MSDTVRLAVIGAGNIAPKHLEAVTGHPLARAVGVFSRTRGEAEALAGRFAIPVVADSAQDLVERARPDALMILVSPENMFEVSVQALDFGLPLFLEKPVALTVDQARGLRDLALERKVPVQVGYNRRHYSIFHKGLQVIREHGPLYGIQVEGHERFFKVRPSGLFSEESLRAWLHVNATHTIDLLRFFGGEPETVHALASAFKEPGGDQFAAALRFPGGTVATYTANWHSPGGWRATLYGEGVTVDFKPLEKGIWTDTAFVSHDIEPEAWDRDYKPGFYGQLDAFLGAVRSGLVDAPSQDLDGTLKTMILAETLVRDLYRP